MNYKLRNIICGIFVNSGIIKLFENTAPLVLMYHNIEKTSFEKQMKYLKKNYNIVSLKYFKKFFPNLPNKTVLITFDDGAYNTVKIAYPILKKLKIPFLVFVTTNFSSRDQVPWWTKSEMHYIRKGYSSDKIQNKIEKIKKLEDIKRLELINSYKTSNKMIRKKVKRYFANWKELLCMDLAEFGSHTISHPILTKCNKNKISKEIIISKDILQKKLNSKIQVIAYPNGDYNQDVLDITRKHYDLGFTTKNGRINSKTLPLEIPRIGINQKDTISSFKSKLSIK